MSKQPKDNAHSGEFAKNIWLAGLGAYGKMFDEASEKYQKAYKDMPKRFRDLVEEGKKLEQQTKQQLHEQVAEPLSKTGKSIEDRIDGVRKTLGLAAGDHSEDLERIEAKIDKLGKTVNALSRELKKMSTASNDKADVA